MPASVASALAAYANAAARGGEPGLPAPAAAGGPSFGSMLEEAAKGSIASLRGAEQMSAKAALGRADLAEVITAVTNAELTLQTVTQVRDKVVSAYQDILRMPI